MSEISAHLSDSDSDSGNINEPPAILIVDDMPANLGLVVDSLADQGFRVLVALDGEEALERAQFSQPDLILLDVKMPGIDEEKSLAAGVNAFLPKPVDFGRLLAQIRVLLNLEWIYAARAHSPQSSSPDVPAAVPAPQMDELHRLARVGNMRDIIAWADRMSLIDPQYEPFTTHLRGLAKGYQSKAILLLVEHYLETRRAP